MNEEMEVSARVPLTGPYVCRLQSQAHNVGDDHTSALKIPVSVFTSINHEE